MGLLWAIAFGLTLATVAIAEPLKICSFNVQIFGASKVKNPTVMALLAKIFSRYDLCLIQEIRDTSDASINALLKAINGGTDNPYRLIVSQRLGRSNSKEQYGFFYNKNKIQVTDSFHFDKVKNGDVFEREPFIVRFAATKAPVKDFFIAGIHTNPGKAREEIANLTLAYDDAVKRFKIQDGIIMGDYNAGCSYFAKKYWAGNAMRQDARFLWLIDDNADTTVGATKCAYDRVVVAGKNLQSRVKTATTFRYDTEYKVDIDTTRLVSDHYPVEFQIE